MTNWVLKDKRTGETILEMYDRGTKFIIPNTERYEMVNVSQQLFTPVLIVDIETIADRNLPKEGNRYSSIVINRQQIEAVFINMIDKLPYTISYDLDLNHTNGTMTVTPKMVYSDNVNELEWERRARINAAQLIYALGQENLSFQLKECL